MYTCRRLVGYQAAIASRLAPTVDWCTSAGDGSAIRPSSRASPAPTVGPCTSAGDGSAVRPSSRASPAPTVGLCTSARGWSAAKVKRSQPSAAPKAGGISRPTSRFPSTARYPRAACSRAAPLRAVHRPCGSWHPGPPGACGWPATILRCCC